MLAQQLHSFHVSGWASSPALSHGHQVPCLPRRRSLSKRLKLHLCAAAMNSDDQPGSTGSTGEQRWFDRLNRYNIQGPDGPQPEPTAQPMGPSLMGEEGFRRWQEVKRTERQRMWDSIRVSAKERYARGEMPSWFDPRWLAQEESPVNQILRESGEPAYQYDDTWLGRSFDTISDQPALAAGGGDDDSGNSGKGGKGRGFWRDDDPYWMLRDWGSHPMRWWTLGFGALLALGGLGTYLFHGSPESLLIGWGAAAWLALCSLAMSDMRYGLYGELGVKAAFGACALLAIKDGVWGWTHQAGSGTQGYDYRRPAAFIKAQQEPNPWDFLILKMPNINFSSFGWSAVAMCTMYIWTGMGGEIDGSLPMNPGAVYKSPDIVMKHRVWKNWGYGNETMRV